MDPTAPLPSRAIALLLVLGPLVFWVGALTPPYRQWMGVPLDEYLRIVGSSPTAWRFMHACFAAGSVLTAFGVSALVSTSSVRWVGAVSSTSFTLATVLWIVVVAHRVAVTPLASEALARDGAISHAYEASHACASLLFGAHAVLSYLGIAAMGLALRGAALPSWGSTLALVVGLVAVPGLLTPLFQPPLLIYVVPFATGIAILSTSR